MNEDPNAFLDRLHLLNKAVEETIRQATLNSEPGSEYCPDCYVLEVNEGYRISYGSQWFKVHDPMFRPKTP